MPNVKTYGPYKHGTRWRLVLRRGDGAVSHLYFASEAAAEQHLEEARGQTGAAVTLRDAVTKYVASLAERGLKYTTQARTGLHLEKMLQLEQHGGRRVTWLRGRGPELYDQAQLVCAVDAHRNGLSVCKAFSVYAVKQGWLRSNPFADVVGKGRRKRGKPQLHVDEARKLMDHCLALCADGAKSEPVAVLTALLLGPRASEVVLRDVRDLDDDGALLWIPEHTKNENSKRVLEVPEVLRPLLLQLARDRIGAAPLFRKADGERGSRWWMYYHCRKLCSAAKVPEISAHGLRGTGSSIARRGGATAELVAEQLGHGSTAVQARGRYVTDRAAEAGRAGAVMQVLQGGRAGNNLGTGTGAGNAAAAK